MTYAKQAKFLVSVPAMRHASVVRTRLKTEIRGDVLREILPDALSMKPSTNTPWQAIGEPDVHPDNTEASKRSGDEPITVKVGVEVFPRIELAN